MKNIKWAYWLNAAFISLLLLTFSCKDDKRALVVGKIHSASKLATTEFTVDKIVHGTKTKKIGWFIKLNEAQFIAHSKARITAGIDLQKLGKDDIEITEEYISLTLPPVEVINFSYPPEDFQMDKDISQNAFANKITIYDQEAYFRSAELDIRNNLQYMGIVETTQTKTRMMLMALLKSLGYDEVYIVFESDELIIDEVPVDNDNP